MSQKLGQMLKEGKLKVHAVRKDNRRLFRLIGGDDRATRLWLQRRGFLRVVLWLEPELEYSEETGAPTLPPPATKKTTSVLDEIDMECAKAAGISLAEFRKRVVAETRPHDSHTDQDTED